MKFKAFEAAAHEAYSEIPEQYREGIDALVVKRDVLPHPTLPDIYTLGMCHTEDHVSEYGSPQTTRSVIALYWGSFQELSRRDPDFDWGEELWETITHELQHHLESLAGAADLEGIDYALDETFKRDQGLDFDPWYYQRGDSLPGGAFQVERNFYLEQLWSATDFEVATRLEFQWRGRDYTVPRPDELGDVHFVWLDGVADEGETLELVLARRRSWWEDAKRLIGAYRPVILESRVTAAEVGRGPA